MKKKKKTQFEFGTYEGDEFECHFQPVVEWAFSMGTGAQGVETRKGRYHGSMFWEVPGFGKTHWAVVGNIVVDWKKLKEDGYSEEEIFKGCIKFLIKPPERKKFQRRVDKSLYGNLSYTPVRTVFKEKHGELILQAIIVTDERRCEQFWGEGKAL